MSTFMTMGLMRKRQSEVMFAVVVTVTVGFALGLLCDVGDGVGECGGPNGEEDDDDDGSRCTVCGVRWVVEETDKGEEEKDVVVEVIEAWGVWDALFHRGL